MKLKELFESPIPRHKKWISGQSLPVNRWGDIDFRNMNLTALEGLPEKVFPGFNCSENKLTSLVGGPKWVGDFYNCSDNLLVSLEGVASYIRGSFFCGQNKLTSLKSIHKHIKFLDGRVDFTNNPIKSHVLGLLKIEGLVFAALDNETVKDILNKHLRGDRDIFACQEELIEAGFPEFAQL